jgi:hypothetical protein
VAVTPHLDFHYAFVGDGPAVAHADDAIAARADLGVVRHEQDRQAALTMEAAQRAKD